MRQHVQILKRIADHAALDAVAVDGGLGKHMGARVAAEIGTMPVVDVARVPAGRDALEVLGALGAFRPDGPGDSAEEAAVVQYTSGSTASPKGVVLTHENVAAGLATIEDGVAWGPDDSLGLWLPLFHDMGLFSLLTGLARGSHVHLWQPSDAIRRPMTWLAEFARSGASLIPAPDFFYEHLVVAAERDGVPEGLDLSRLRAATNGAELVHERTIRRFHEAFAPHGLRPDTMRPTYGMAEATLMVSVVKPGKPHRTLFVERDSLAPGSRPVLSANQGPESRQVVSCGGPAGSVRIRLGSSDGAPSEDGVVGEVQISGPPVTAGYLDLPADQQPLTPDGWLRTGDLAFVHDGEVYIVGRVKAMIAVKGVNHYAEDVEAVVRTTPGVDGRRCAAFAWQDPADDSESLVVLWETPDDDPDQRTATEGAIRRRLRDHLGLTAVEMSAVSPATIPFTSSGKVKRDHARRLWPEVSQPATAVNARESS